MDPELAKAKQSPSYLEGYTDLAAYLSSDRELNVCKRYRTLSARNILYLQAEVAVLEDELRRLDEADLEASQRFDAESMDILQAARDWESFARKAGSGDARMARKMAAVVRLRSAMREYRMRFGFQMST